MIYDPGICIEWDLMNDVLAAIGTRTERPKSVTKGAIRVNGSSIALNVILFDSVRWVSIDDDGLLARPSQRLMVVEVQPDISEILTRRAQPCL